MKRSKLPLVAVRAFEAAGRHRSLRRAAEELGISETAVGAQVRQLEELLGTTLVDRRRRTIQLNSVGTRLLEELSRSLDLMGDALDAATSKPFKDEVVVSVEPTFASMFLLPSLEKDKELTDHLDVEVVASVNLAGLGLGGPTLAIRHSRHQTSWPSLEAQRLFDVSLTPVCSAAFSSSLQTPQDLADLPLLHDESRAAWSSWLAACGVEEPRFSGLVFSHGRLAVEAALADTGVALVDPRFVSGLLDRGDLVRPFEQVVAWGSYWIVAADFSELTVAERRFSDWLLNLSREEEAADGLHA